ncbi:TauD/TfdA dioxygenase family protein [Aspergillus affinis]|uniref:TauD/TfdA dioxygenase family protein n=1 Tax=Aspergillus affinis TaxID=1070780 RepID=UPI0022FE9FFA|nr:alpha-ketoglutarate-dependent sulfonate dioxygenase [Aspergillus affinis]KAI9039354.1 alpha-ketoglutarate-dependent sulfonate dioxygenase [Aspergillus affinis]
MSHATQHSSPKSDIDNIMAHLESRKHISPDSGFPVTLHPKFNAKIRDHVPPDPIRDPFTPPKDRAFLADKKKKALFSIAKHVDLTESIGTVLENVQLSQLSGQQLDELALLVNERGVVFFRDQDLTTEKQVELFEHYAPSYSLLRMEEHPDVGGDTAWVSQYGLYDALSTAYRRFLDGLHAVHTSRLQYDTILDLWGVGPNRPPIDTHHPAVRTHPVTGLKALNVNPGFVTGFAELKKLESDKLLDFLSYHIHAADDHYVRWKWAIGSVAMWDNRCSLHRVIPGTYKGARRGIRTTVFGEKPYLDPASESRLERQTREKNEILKEGEQNNEDIGDGPKIPA